jgi:hypothetical protein
MPITAVTQWSSTAGSNTDIGGININEGWFPDAVNNSIRELMAQVATQLGKANAFSTPIAAASNTNLALATGWYVEITGSTTISQFGTVPAGQMYILKFSGTPTIVHHSSGNIMPNGVNISALVGDTAFMVSLGGGSWRCVSYITPPLPPPVTPTLAAGTYMPVVGTTLNMNSVTTYSTQWLRVGNTVTVGGLALIDPATVNLCQFHLSIPVVSNFTAIYHLGGAGVAMYNNGGLDKAYGVVIRANPTTNEAQFDYLNYDGAGIYMSYTYTYAVT